MNRSLRNGLACDMALGCSSNTVLHLLAIAKEAQVETRPQRHQRDLTVNTESV